MRVLLGTDNILSALRFVNAVERATAFDDPLRARLRAIAAEVREDATGIGMKLACQCGHTDFRLMTARTLRCTGCAEDYLISTGLRFVVEPIAEVAISGFYQEAVRRAGDRQPTEAELREGAEFLDFHADADVFAALWRDAPPADDRPR